jgi:hypothetical protein
MDELQNGLNVCWGGGNMKIGKKNKTKSAKNKEEKGKIREKVKFTGNTK